MISLTVFIPQTKGRIKYSTRIFYKDKRKIYYDYIKIKYINTEHVSETIENIRRYYNQLIIFYIRGNRAYIAHEEGLVKLSKRFLITVTDKKLLKFYIKQFINKFTGCIVYQSGKEYTIENWSI